MTTATRSLPAHGTYERARGGHRSGTNRCHCKPCRDAEAAYTKRRNYLASTGRPLLVDAAPVQKHLHHLRAAGDAYTHIADITGLRASTVDAIALGRRRRVRATTAATILALPPGKAAARNRSVPALGTTRRLRALLALGHKLGDVAAASSVELSTASYLLNGRVATIHHGLAQRIDNGYRALCTSRGNSTRSLNRAQREGWAPPAAWDDIDDPASAPDTGTKSSPSARELSRLRHAEIAHLAAYGIPEHEIAARLGMATAYVHDLIRDMRKEAAA
ncbi:hypothetical protein OG897_13335 [Streptomyces sp. NBC_00237]|uniref:hypothetical protein n=1 Tax=Streptomyces sp. NBC_00237 TaxID=2975687 RepID=UPI00225BF1D7|nr:hypothetical protein [Streptomyces sp. NBC_00237]MCX5202426.1 hypothetical protein [Streptomyces sp. NBC_00237]